MARLLVIFALWLAMRGQLVTALSLAVGAAQ